MLTERGWLVLYHGVRGTGAGTLYRVGAMLLERDRPDRVIGYAPHFIFGPEEVYERSANMFVAAFIGLPPTNFFPAEVRREDGRVHLVHPRFDLVLDEAHAARLEGYGKRRLVIGVRPENIRLTDPANALFSADVLVVEPQGSHQVIAFRFEGETVKVVAPARPKVRPGERIHLTFHLPALRFYDPETTRAIGD